jgi:cysteine synthase A
MCRVLGYDDCTVFIPEDMPAARIEQIRSFGAKVCTSPPGMYIGGLVKGFARFLADTPNAGRYDVPNHSFDTRFAPAATRQLGLEIVDDLAELGLKAPNYFVCALGNGISARGTGEALLKHGTTLIGMEPYESPTVLRSYFPDLYAREYPSGTGSERHEVYGTGAGKDAGIEFPNIKAIAPKLSRILLPRPDQWRQVHGQLLDVEAKHVGNSSAACVWAALELAKTVPPKSTILTVFYDAYWRYLPIGQAHD